MQNKASLDDPFLPLAFSLYSNPGAYAVLAGAGVSRGAGLPAAWDIVVDLIARMAQGDEITVDTAEGWYEKRFNVTPTYSDVVNQLALTRAERQALLRGYFENDAERIEPSIAHRSVARLMASGAIRVVLTINFDRLFEQALHEVGIEPTVVATDAEARGLGPLHLIQHCVIHLHGDYLNAMSMRNTAAELLGYPRHMNTLLRRVVSEYGLLVAGWSATYDPALRDAIAAHYSSRFTMGWIDPHMLSSDAAAIVTNKRALSFKTTADDALGHLADEVESMRDRSARHPLTLDVAVSRIKRQLSGDRPSIAAHDMIAAEISRLRGLQALQAASGGHLDKIPYRSLLDQIKEGCRIPVGSAAALAYWGSDSTDRWWIPEIERLARLNIAGGDTALLELPLFAASIFFYTTGLSAVAAGRFDLLRKLFDLRGNRIGQRSQPVSGLLRLSVALDEPKRPQHDYIVNLGVEALNLGEEQVRDALQLFDILRFASQIGASEDFDALVQAYGGRFHKFVAGTKVRATEEESSATAQEVIQEAAGHCNTFRAHILTTDRNPEVPDRQWCSPLAERLADEVARHGDAHPIVSGMQMGLTGTVLALKGVSAAAGKVAKKLEWQMIPMGTVGVLPDEIWLDEH